jgi:phosphonate transport system substrate-binding protein
MRRDFLKILFVFTAPLLVGCNAAKPDNAPGAPEPTKPAVRALTISAIPDQDPEKLQRLYGSLATYLSSAIGSSVEYKPVTDYKAAVTAFKVGDLDLVWFGGLTGVQARIQVPGAEAILQRDIDEKFTSIFIANKKAGISSLTDLKGKTFTFGSESSTSGRLMPQYFLEKAGVALEDFKGRPGFSGSHDKTIELVTAGSFEAGVVNAQVWQKRLADGKIDTSKVAEFSTTPPYHDYHWVLHPEAEKRLGNELKAKLVAAFTALNPEKTEDAKILELFGAKRFIETRNDNYAQIEQVGRSTELIVADARR